jgi:hypothetical protein
MRITMPNFFSKSSSSQNTFSTTTKWLLGAGVTTAAAVGSAVYALRNGYQPANVLASLNVAGDLDPSASSDIVGGGFIAGDEFRVNTHQMSTQTEPCAVGLSNEDFIIVWQSNGQDGSATGIYGQRYNKHASVQGGSFQVNTYTTGDQGFPAVAKLKNDGFVVAWEGEGFGDSTGIYARCYNSNGIAQGGEFLVNTYTTAV